MKADFRGCGKPRKTTMMDDALKTHKETTFGWVLTIQNLVTAYKARLIRRAREQEAEAARAAKAAPRRYLTPR